MVASLISPEFNAIGGNATWKPARGLGRFRFLVLPPAALTVLGLFSGERSTLAALLPFMLWYLFMTYLFGPGLRRLGTSISTRSIPLASVPEWAFETFRAVVGSQVDSPVRIVSALQLGLRGRTAITLLCRNTGASDSFFAMEVIQKRRHPRVGIEYWSQLDTGEMLVTSSIISAGREHGVHKLYVPGASLSELRTAHYSVDLSRAVIQDESQIAQQYLTQFSSAPKSTPFYHYLPWPVDAFRKRKFAAAL